MPKTIYCPFWGWDESKVIHCECGKLDFPDRRAKHDYEETCCGDQQAWRQCSLAVALQKYYERTCLESGDKA